MDCLNEEKILRYTNGLLADDEAVAVADHIRHCRACAGAVESDRIFDEGLRAALKENFSFETVWESVANKIHNKEVCRDKRSLRWFAITGGFISALAIFNSMLLAFLTLYLSDFSVTKLIMNFKNLLSVLGEFFGFYAIWLDLASATLVAAVMTTAVIALYFKRVMFKPVKI